MREYVSDTGPLISFEIIPGGFMLLRRLVGGILVPPEVVDELSVGLLPGSDYLAHYGIADFVRVEPAPAAPAATAGLHEGESAAITLALARKLPLLIEERQGRQVALALGVETIGAIGLLLYACNIGIITVGEAEGCVQALFQGKRMNRTLLEALLAQLRVH
jgi:predicted nucleic acid-binding protein